MKRPKDLQLELLNKYFHIDGDVATLNLVYDSFSELINPNFGDDKTEKLNDKLLSDIRDAVALLPRKYKLDLKIIIRDFGDYKVEECEKIIRDNIYLSAYCLVKENHKKKINGFSLIGIGALVLLGSYFLRNYDLWFDLINISGTLFVWEGVNTAFIERNQYNKASRAIARSIKNISISGETDKVAQRSKTKPTSKKTK